MASAALTAMRHLPTLTPLRGIAALMIVLFHFTGPVLPNLDPTAHTMVVANGYLAVDLFFLISGFVICHVYQQRFARSVSMAKFLGFVRARFARLYPMHIATLAFLVVGNFSTYAVLYIQHGIVELPPWEGVMSDIHRY